MAKSHKLLTQPITRHDITGVIMKRIAIVGTLDTKFEEMGFIQDFITKKGHDAVIIDAGIMGAVPFAPQISRDKVAEAAGMSLHEVQALGDEGKAIAFMAEGASRVVW